MPTNEINKTDDIICGCTGTTKEKITQLIQTGCSTLDDIVSKTGATTGCGSCDVTVVDFMKQQTEAES